MGIFVNPGSAKFKEAIRSQIYVDKTGMIGYLNSVVNTKQKYVCVSRPRRFGKTMAADMLCAYYDRTADSRPLFENRVLANSDAARPWDEYLGKFDVIHISMTDFFRRNEPVADSLARVTRRILTVLGRLYPDVESDPSDLSYSMEEYYYASGLQFVIAIDEWDALFRTRKDDKAGQTDYLNFLRDWLKDKSYVALAYMTGILPIKKYGEHSALNMFDEYSMTAPLQLAPYTGFTVDEVKALCDEYAMDYGQVSDWYDGYVVRDYIPANERTARHNGDSDTHTFHLYSPLSVVNAMRNGRIQNYWNATESYEALAEYIRRDYDGLKQTVALLMDGAHVPADISSYQNDMTTFHGKDDILALLIHLGYLGYDEDAGEVFIPNKEVLDVFRTSTKSDEWTSTFRDYDRDATRDAEGYKRHTCVIERA